MNNSTATLNDVIARYQRRIDAIKQIRELVTDDPAIAAELIVALQSVPPAPTREIRPARSTRSIRRRRPTHRDRIHKFFASCENKWQTSREIMIGTGLNRGGVSHIFYKGFPDDFEHKPHPQKARVQLWRLANFEGNGQLVAEGGAYA